MGTYIFDQAWVEEKRRLGALGHLYDHGSIGHLVDLGVRPGWGCWEVGAGSGTIASWLAERVGNHGKVLATDIDTRFLEHLAAVNVEVRKHDVVGDAVKVEAFDLVHARALLEHLPERSKALSNMVSSLRPGGWLLAEDVVFAPPVCHPDLPVATRIIDDAARRAFRAVGADPDYGVRLPGALADAGLVDVSCAARVPIVRSGTSSADFMVLTLEHLSSQMVASGLITAHDAEEVLAALGEPGKTVFAPIMVAAWGRRPAA